MAEFVYGSEYAIATHASATLNKASICVLDSTHLLLSYFNSATRAALKVAVYSGSTISSVGSEYPLMDARNGAYSTSVCALTSSLAVCLYDNDYTPGLEVIAATISGTTVSRGTMTAVVTGASYGAKVVRLDDSHFVMIWKIGNNCTVQAGSVSGTTITLGSAVNLQTNASYGKWPDITRLDDTHFVVSYGGKSTSEWDAVVQCCSVSGVTITAGTALTAASVAGTAFSKVARLTDTTFVVIYDKSGDSKVYSKVGTVSGTTISLGSEYLARSPLYNNTYKTMGLEALTSTLVVYYDRAAADGKGYEIQGAVSGTTLSWSSEQKFRDTTILQSDYHLNGAVRIDDTTIAFCYTDNTNKDLYAIIGNIPYTKTYSGSGSMTLSGASDYLANGSGFAYWKSSGTATFSGSATCVLYSKNYVKTTSGTATFSGASTTTHTRSYAKTATGTATFAGSASKTIVLSKTGSGTLTISGSASKTIVLSKTGSGTATFSGVAVTSNTRNYSKTGSGTVTFSGAATCRRDSINFFASGSMTLSGTSPSYDSNLFFYTPVSVSYDSSPAISIARVTDSRFLRITVNDKKVYLYEESSGSITEISNVDFWGYSGSPHYVSVAVIDSSNFVISYSYSSHPTYIKKCRLGTISGNTLSLGSEIELPGISTPAARRDRVYVLDSTHILFTSLAWDALDPGGLSPTAYVIGTINSGNITFGSVYNDTEYNTNGAGVAVVLDSSHFIIVTDIVDTVHNAYVKAAHVHDVNQITFGTKLSILTTEFLTGGISTLNKINSTQAIVGFMHYDTSYHSKLTVVTLSSDTVLAKGSDYEITTTGGQVTSPYITNLFSNYIWAAYYTTRGNAPAYLDYAYLRARRFTVSGTVISLEREVAQPNNYSYNYPVEFIRLVDGKGILNTIHWYETAQELRAVELYVYTKTAVGSGQVTTSGSSSCIYTWTYIKSTSGSIALSGTADHTIQYSRTGLGSLYLSGTSPPVYSIDFIGSGTLTFHGYAWYGTIWFTGTGIGVFGGSAITSRTRFYTGSGAATFAGSSPAVWTKVLTATVAGGTATLSGHAESYLERKFDGSGSILLYGTSAVDVGKVFRASGGMTFGGSCSAELFKRYWEYRPTGGILYFSSSAITANNRIFIPRIGGSALLSGSPSIIYSKIYLASASGSITLSGSPHTSNNRIFLGPASGSVNLSGSSAVQMGFRYIGDGTLTTGGTSETVRDRFCTGSGTISLSGAAYTIANNIYYARLTYGTMTFSGHAPHRWGRFFEYVGTGSLATSGAATAFYRQSYRYIGSGQATFGGSGSSVLYTKVYKHTGSGLLRISESATYYKPVQREYTGSGTLRTGRFAYYNHSKNYSCGGSGLILLSGKSNTLYSAKSSFISSGSATLSGSASYLVSYIFATTGLGRFAGSATCILYSKNFIVSTSGRAVLSGTAVKAYTRNYTYVGSGTITLTSAPVLEIEILEGVSEINLTLDLDSFMCITVDLISKVSNVLEDISQVRWVA